MSPDGFFNPPYRSKTGPDGADELSSVPPAPSVEDEAAHQFGLAEQRIEGAMGTFMGNIFKIVCGIIGILIVISVGIAILAGIWRVWIF
jgi:hypothetical protein